MSKKNAVLAKAEEIARGLGALPSTIENVKRQLAAIWGEDETPAAPAPEPTDTFNVLVGVEVKRSALAYQGAVEAAVESALASAASGRDEVVSFSVTGA